MTTGSEERNESGADQPRGARDGDAQGGAVGELLVSSEVGGGHGVSVTEQALELGADERRAKERAEGSEWEAVLDRVVEDARVRAVGLDAMGVDPVSERPAELDVAELPSLDVVPMLHGPAAVDEGRYRYEDHDPIAGLDPATALDAAHLLPRRAEALEGARTLVPLEEGGRRRSDGAASGECVCRHSRG